MNEPPRKEVKNEVVHLDYADLRDTNYTDCKLVYKGGTPPAIGDCTFLRCSFIFENEALNTMQFLLALASGTGGRDLVLRQFLGIKDD